MKTEYERDQWLRKLCLKALNLDRNSPEYMKLYKRIDRYIPKMDENLKQNIEQRQEKIFEELKEFILNK